MQVHETVIDRFYVCYVAHPYLVGGCRYDSGYKIGILVHPMITPGRTYGLVAALVKQGIALKQ